MKIESYIIRILQNAGTKRYFGEVIVNGKREIQTLEMTAETNAIKALNQRIKEFNNIEGANLPKFPEIRGSKPIVFNNILDRIEQVEQVEQVKPKSSKPKRKPFTPYGLQGYFVDKNGNIRLMLDRKACGKTVTLDTDFFAALSEMVKRTQEANNAKQTQTMD